MSSLANLMEFSGEVAANVSNIVDEYRSSCFEPGNTLWQESCACDCFQMAKSMAFRYRIGISDSDIAKTIANVLVLAHRLEFKDEFIQTFINPDAPTEAMKKKRQEALDDLTRLTEDMGLYEHQRNSQDRNAGSSQDQNAGVKFDQDKPRFDLVPQGPYYKVVELYTHGAKKYGDRNWEKGIVFSRLIAAAQRHLHSFVCGEDSDQESGCHHLASVVFYCFAMMEFQIRGRKELDDRQSYVNKPESEVKG